MKDSKAAKLMIKRAKRNPFLYSTSEIVYAKMIKKNIKQEKKEKSIDCEQVWREYKDSIKFIDILYNNVIISTQ